MALERGPGGSNPSRVNQERTTGRSSFLSARHTVFYLICVLVSFVRSFSKTMRNWYTSFLLQVNRAHWVKIKGFFWFCSCFLFYFIFYPLSIFLFCAFNAALGEFLLLSKHSPWPFTYLTPTPNIPSHTSLLIPLLQALGLQALFSDSASPTQRRSIHSTMEVLEELNQRGTMLHLHHKDLFRRKVSLSFLPRAPLPWGYLGIWCRMWAAR